LKHQLEDYIDEQGLRELIEKVLLRDSRKRQETTITIELLDEYVSFPRRQSKEVLTVIESRHTILPIRRRCLRFETPVSEDDG